MNKLIIFCALGGLLLLACQPEVQPPAVDRWEEHAITLTSSVIYSNPYTEVTAWVVFTHPEKGITLRRPAFWDGEQRWQVRVALSETGNWTWESFSEPATDTDLHGQTGRLTVNESVVDHPLQGHGLLRMAPGGRNVMHADGKPFLLVGDTPWALPFRATYETALRYARDRQEKGYNAALLMTVQPDQDAQGPDARDTVQGFARSFADLHQGHLNGLKPAYFQYFDSLITLLLDHGIVPVYQPVFHGFGWKGKRVLGPEADPDEYRRYQRYLIARYGARPAFWLISGDAHGLDPGIGPAGEETEAWDSYQQPTGIHYNPFDDYQPDYMPAARCFHDNNSYQEAPWLDFQWCQTGHNSEHLYHKVQRMYENKPTKAVANGEPTYEGMGGGKNGLGWWQGEEAWQQLLHGGTMGVVYGAAGLWQWKVTADEAGWDKWATGPGSWEDALAYEGSRYPGYLSKAFADYDFLGMEKHPELAGGLPCLAKPGEFYVLYLPDGGNRTLLQLTTSLPYRWFDPQTGQWQEGGQTEGNRMTFNAPSQDPWVLMVGEWE